MNKQDTSFSFLRLDLLQRCYVASHLPCDETHSVASCTALLPVPCKKSNTAKERFELAAALGAGNNIGMSSIALTGGKFIGCQRYLEFNCGMRAVATVHNEFHNAAGDKEGTVLRFVSPFILYSLNLFAGICFRVHDKLWLGCNTAFMDVSTMQNVPVSWSWGTLHIRSVCYRKDEWHGHDRPYKIFY